MESSYDQLVEMIEGCTRCPLSATRTRVVPGTGPLDADIVFVGEAPGPEEDVAGVPFIGRAGKVLRALIVEIGLPMEQVFFLNLLKCYPTDGEPNSRGYLQFRAPKLDEIDKCDPYLQAQLDIIRPKVVIPLGLVPTHQWFPGVTMGEIHGVLRRTDRYLLAPTYHPSAVARGGTHLRELMLADIRRAVSLVGLLGKKASVSGL